MRLPAESADEATETLAGIQSERDGRSLPTMQLLAAGLPGTLRLALPERRGQRPISLLINVEGGDAKRLKFVAGGLQEIRRIAIAGETLCHLAVPLPGLPPGYHDLVLEEDPARPCRLIVGPRACFLGAGIGGGARLFGLTTHLYALRHQRDLGIGDFETLSQFCEVTANLGGSFAGI